VLSTKIISLFFLSMPFFNPKNCKAFLAPIFLLGFFISGLQLTGLSLSLSLSLLLTSKRCVNIDFINTIRCNNFKFLFTFFIGFYFYDK
jgi:hypothetical protein